jgi:hypothetical protein
MSKKKEEGWLGLFGYTPKFHYFVGGKSLCKKWFLALGVDELKKGNDDSPDNCRGCVGRLVKRKSLRKTQKGELNAN